MFKLFSIIYMVIFDRILQKTFWAHFEVVIKLSAFFPLNIPFYFSSFECFILYFSAVLFCVFRLFHFMFFGSFVLLFSSIVFSTSTPLPSISPARSPYLLCPRGSRYGSPRDKRSPAPPASPAV